MDEFDTNYIKPLIDSIDNILNKGIIEKPLDIALASEQYKVIKR
jgi:hypothetical protein